MYVISYTNHLLPEREIVTQKAHAVSGNLGEDVFKERGSQRWFHGLDSPVAWAFYELELSKRRRDHVRGKSGTGNCWCCPAV